MKKPSLILAATILMCLTLDSCGKWHLLGGRTGVPVNLRTDLLEFTEVDFGKGRCAKIASRQPRFSWVVPSAGDGTRQVAYRIVVYEWEEYSSQKIDGRGNPLWNSGWVESDASVAVPYLGPDLNPDNEYCWAVELRMTTASGRRVQTAKSDYKRFKTDKTLSDYATPSYPLVAERQTAASAANGIYDFGKAAFGKLELTLTAAADDSIMVIIGERLKDGHIEHTPRISSVLYDEIGLRVKAGTHTYLVEPNRDGRNTGPMAVPLPDYAGIVSPFRYCEICGNVTPVKVGRISYNYPFNEKAASFRCSNDTLNTIWELCHYSLKPCSFTGIWVDGNRERIPYEYDALIAQLCHYGSDAEYSIDRRTLEWLLEKPTWPTEWILYAVEIAWNDYLWTGDSRALRANYQILKAHGLDALRKENGLVSTTQGQSPTFLASINRDGEIKDIVDWPHSGILGLDDGQGGEDDGFVYSDYNAVVNALYYRTLQRLASIARVLAKEDAEGFTQPADSSATDAEHFHHEAAETFDAFQKAFFNPAADIYKDGIETGHSSLHTNMMAVLCGLTTPENQAAVADFIESRGLRCSIFGAHNLLQALYTAGRGDAALRMMTRGDIRSWYNGIRAGSTITMEAWDDSFKPNQDWNHIAGAAPGNAIPFGLMGITPLEPGLSQVAIRPQPGNLEWAEITVPTIRGSISVSIRKGRMEVIIPPNMTAEIYLPGQNEPAATVGSGRYMFKY